MDDKTAYSGSESAKSASEPPSSDDARCVDGEITVPQAAAEVPQEIQPDGVVHTNGINEEAKQTSDIETNGSELSSKLEPAETVNAEVPSLHLAAEITPATDASSEHEPARTSSEVVATQDKTLEGVTPESVISSSLIEDKQSDPFVSGSISPSTQAATGEDLASVQSHETVTLTTEVVPPSQQGQDEAVATVVTNCTPTVSSELPVVFRTSSSEEVKQLPPANFGKSSSGMLLASTTILTEVTSVASTTVSLDERKTSRLIPETFPEGESAAARIALTLDARRPQANAPALQSVLTAIEKDARQCAAELITVLSNTREHVKNATTISLEYMKTMNQNAQNVHSAVDVAVDQASSFIHQVAELEKELSCLDELQANLNLTKDYLTGLEQYVQSL
jgi:hypothetical protein